MDAIAAPFVQGRLRGEWVEVEVASECAWSKRPLHIRIDSDLHYNVREQGAAPVIFAPLKVARPGAASIIDDF